MTTRASKERQRATWKIAVHEAGHMVAAYNLKIPIYRATIRPTGDWSGHVRHKNLLHNRDIEGEKTMRGRDRMERTVLCTLAGNAAVHQVCGINDGRSGAAMTTFYKTGY